MGRIGSALRNMRHMPREVFKTGVRHARPVKLCSTRTRFRHQFLTTVEIAEEIVEWAKTYPPNTVRFKDIARRTNWLFTRSTPGRVPTAVGFSPILRR